MVKLRKNFWLIFVLVSLVASVTFVSYSVKEWRQVKEKSARYQSARLTMFADSTWAFFSQLSATFDLLGEHLIENNRSENDIRLPIIDKLVKQNPGIKAMVVMRMDGTPVAMSSNFIIEHPERNTDNPLALFMQSQLPNGTILKPSHQSLVKGATESVIPFGRFVGRSKDSNVPLLAVTSGIVFEKMPLFHEKIGDRKYLAFEVIREDRYLQYSIRSEFFDLSKQVPDSYFKQVTQHHSLDNQNPRLTTLIKNGEPYQAAVVFNSALGLWFVSSIPNSELIADYSKNQIPLTIGFISFLIGFYLLLRYIYYIQLKNAKTLRYQLEHDYITNLPNRIYLKNNLDRWLTEHETSWLFFIDIDKFKDVNEGFGYSVGDLLLVEIAERIIQLVGKEALVIREYANKFIVVFSSVDEHSPDEYGEILQSRLAEPYDFQSLQITVSASVGIVACPEHGDNFHDIMMSADIALSDAKKSRNAVTLLSSGMVARYQSRVQIGKLLRVAIEDELPYMVFQPQINREGKVQSLEALVRWTDEQFGFIPPDKFIHVAEVTGQMNQLGFLIINKSFRDFSCIQASVSHPLSLSLNVSVQQLSDKRFLPFIVDAMSRYGICGSSIVIEVTESIFIDDIQSVRPVCRQLEFYGIRLSLDDFGTGYSSLSVLKKLKINELKIDRSFVMSMNDNQKAMSLVQTILKLARQQKMKSVAEGVETKEQHLLLLQSGCDLFQGYYFSKPLEVLEIIDFINNWNGGDLSR